MKNRALPPRLRVWILFQTLAAVAIAYVTWRTPHPETFGLLAFLVLFGILGGACKVDLSVTVGVLSLGFTATYFALITLGTSEAILVALLSAFATVVCDFRNQRRPFRFGRAFSLQSLFNYGNGVLATGAMGWVFHALGGVPGRFDLSGMALPILASAFTYYVVNTGGVTLAIAWQKGGSVAREFRENWAWTWSGYVAGACISAALLWAYQWLRNEVGVFLFLPPAYLVYYFYRLRSDKARSDIQHMREVNRLNEAVIGSLAMAIEAKDRYTRKHVNRVREYAVRLGEKLGITPDELEAVRIASLLHDIGKIGIPESILCKPGKLTSDEFEIIKSHVDIGAAILERINFPWPVAPVVRTHHERWDGLGYPRGLRGEDIPVGGRIISLVDVYDALTSDRPYRSAITREQAIQILRAGSGSQFDPVVVETFIGLLPEMDEAIRRIQEAVDEDEEALQEAMASVAVATARPVDETEDAAVLQELAGLVQSECGLVVMAPQLVEKIARLVPYTTCAIYLKGLDQRNLVPIYASGLWTELLEGMEIRMGEGVTGYVAARREPLLNAAAALDLARRLRPSENLELNSTLCVPLMLGEEAVGVITLYHSSYNFYQGYHVDRLNRIAAYAVQALEHSRRYQLELPLPSQDPVTGLPNRHALRQFLAAQLNVSQTQEGEFTVVQVALEATHNAAAECQAQVLESMARILKDAVRENDYVARSGSNSFSVVLPGCGEREARRTTGRIVEAARAQGLAGVGGVITLRAGVAVYRRDGATPESLLEATRSRMRELRAWSEERPLVTAGSLAAD